MSELITDSQTLELERLEKELPNQVQRNGVIIRIIVNNFHFNILPDGSTIRTFEEHDD